MGTKVTTDYSDLVFSLGILPEHISVLIRGDHGVGKSAIARQMAKSLITIIWYSTGSKWGVISLVYLLEG